MEQIDILKNGYKIIQDSERFQFGIDAVLLADFAMGGEARSAGGVKVASSVKAREKVIDLGTGTGIIPLLMAGNHRWLSLSKPNTIANPLNKIANTWSNFIGLTTPVQFTGLEVQKESADMASRSVELNGLEDRIHIVHGDLREVGRLFDKHSFNIVTCNPPYMIDSHGRGNQLDAKTIARHEVLCTLEDVVSAADYLLATHGRFFMIHRPFRLPEIFESLVAHGLEPKRMRLIQPFADKEPNMVLIEARKNAKRRLTIEPPLVVRYDDGEYTAEITRIYGDYGG